ncbi:hypothetical protein N7536_000498 [Penicillium majusculum]|nr:hypothetical protein N7536_000498 [Penicillium majusculum]
MQHIQESQQGPRSQQRQQISPNKQHIFPSLPHDGLHSQAFESHTGMILDIFDGASGQPNSFLQLESTNKFMGDKWADLLPSNYVSPADSDDGPSDDIQKSNLLDSEFNNFNFSEFGILDSGLFSSDAPHTDPFRMGTKKKPAGQEHGSQQAISLPKAGLNFIDIFPSF